MFLHHVYVYVAVSAVAVMLSLVGGVLIYLYCTDLLTIFMMTDPQLSRYILSAF